MASAAAAAAPTSIIKMARAGSVASIPGKFVALSMDHDDEPAQDLPGTVRTIVKIVATTILINSAPSRIIWRGHHEKRGFF